MAISFQCTCGKPLTAKSEMAGRKTKCPHCAAILTIPGTLVKSATSASPKSGAAIPTNPDALVVEGLVWTTDAPPGSTPAEPSAVSTAPPAGSDRMGDLPKPSDGTLQYKVLSQKDYSASGKINFASLEAGLNEQARSGWGVKAAFVINIPGHGGNHDELVVILER